MDGLDKMARELLAADNAWAVWDAAWLSAKASA